MPPTYFDRNQNLQVNGDINFISAGGPSQDDTGKSLSSALLRANVTVGNATDFFHVAQRVQAKAGKSRAIERGLKILSNNTAPSALYGYGNSFTGPQCHPGTRIALQDDIFKWFNDPNGEMAMWMNGPVGIGKSAIAQTIAHKAAQQEQLSSTFFFFRSDDKRNSTKHFVATLAYSMTQQLPLTRDSVCEAIAADPLIFSHPLDHQIQSVILKPLHCSNKTSSEGPKLIVIDGLDECLDTGAQQGIIRSFISNFLSRSTQIIPHKLLIVSRPESHIAAAFSESDIHAQVKHLSLGSWKTEDDLGVFLRDKLKVIQDTHPMKHHLPDVWPDNISFHALRSRSKENFAYATCVIRFLESHKHHPEHALRDILSLQPCTAAAAFANLDTLYRHILSSLDIDICFTVQKVLCLYLYSRNSDIATLAKGLSEGESVLEIALMQVSSLVCSNSHISIKLHHSSFEEFLRDKGRSGDYHVFSPIVTSAVATSLSNIWSNPDSGIIEFDWFHVIGNSIWYVNNNLDNHILRALVATKMPASFQPVSYAPSLSVFFQAIQRRCADNSDVTHGPLYSKAFDVVCLWLRSQLNAHFQSLATLSDVLGITQNNWKISQENILSIYIFSRLVKSHCKPLDFLCRLFPEMDYVEVYSGIMEQYLALSIQSRQLDQANYFSCPITLSTFYVNVLAQSDIMDPRLCRRLEQLALDGQKALGFKSYQDKTSKVCIFLGLYGKFCRINNEGPEHTQDIDNYRVGCSCIAQDMSPEIVEKTDDYIREAHMKLDFPYISEEVASLYHLESEKHSLPTVGKGTSLRLNAFLRLLPSTRSVRQRPNP